MRPRVVTAVPFIRRHWTRHRRRAWVPTTCTWRLLALCGAPCPSARAPAGREVAPPRPACRDRRADATRPGRAEMADRTPCARRHRPMSSSAIRATPSTWCRPMRAREKSKPASPARPLCSSSPRRCETGTRTFSKKIEPRPIARWPWHRNASALCQAGPSAREAGDAVRAGFGRAGAAEHDGDVGLVGRRNRGLLAVDDVMVAGALDLQAQVGGVRPAARLGQRDRSAPRRPAASSATALTISGLP